MTRAARYLVICLNNEGYEASLERRKVYVAIPDEGAARHGLTRLIDESGEDYLYPSEGFVTVDLPASVRKAVLAAA